MHLDRPSRFPLALILCLSLLSPSAFAAPTGGSSADDRKEEAREFSGNVGAMALVMGYAAAGGCVPCGAVGGALGFVAGVTYLATSLEDWMTLANTSPDMDYDQSAASAVTLLPDEAFFEPGDSLTSPDPAVAALSAIKVRYARIVNELRLANAGARKYYGALSEGEGRDATSRSIETSIAIAAAAGEIASLRTDLSTYADIVANMPQVEAETVDDTDGMALKQQILASGPCGNFPASIEAAYSDASLTALERGFLLLEVAQTRFDAVAASTHTTSELLDGLSLALAEVDTADELDTFLPTGFPISQAIDLGFVGTLTLELGTDSAQVAQTTGVARVTVPSGSLLARTVSLSNPAIAASGVVFGTGTTTMGAMPQAFQYSLTGASAGVLSGAMVGTTPSLGTLPLAGSLRVCLISDCSSAHTVPLQIGTASIATGTMNAFQIGGPWLPPQPMSNAMRSGVLAFGGTDWAFQHTPSSAWFEGGNDPIWGVTWTGTHAAGFRHGPASSTSGSTAQAGGALQFVAPLVVVTPMDTPMVRRGAARYTVEFVPEPTSGLSLTAGLVAVLVAGLRRRRRF